MGTRRKKSDNAFLMQGAILAAAGIVSKIIGLAYRIPLINIMGDKGQGFYTVAFQIYGIALLLTSYSLPLAVSKLVAARVERGERRNAFRVFKGALAFAIVVGSAISLIVFFGAGFIASNMMSLDLSVYALRVLAPGLLIVAIMGVVRGYFQGMGTMLPTAISQILEQIVNAVVSIVGASFLLQFGKKAAAASKNDSLGPAYAAAGGTLGTVIGALIGLAFLIFVFYAYKSTIRKQLRNDRSRHKESYQAIYVILFMTIAPVIMSTAIYNISSVIDSAMFSKIMSIQGVAANKYATLLGMYGGKYNTLIDVPLAMANALGASAIPSLAAAVQSKDHKLIHKKITMVIRFAMIIAIPSAVGYMVLARPIMDLLFGGKNATPALMLRLGAITVIFYCLSTITNAALQGVNRMTEPLKNASISLVIHLLSLFIMLVVFKWSIYSVIISKIIFSLSMCILNSISLRQSIAYIQEKQKTFVIPLMASLIMGVIAFGTHLVLDIFVGGRVATVLALLIAMLSYGVSLLMLGGLSSDEILALPKGATLLTVFKKLHLIPQEYY